MLIIGLSGTGKTTTTFRRQAGSLPVQDDFVALMPGGHLHTSEAGCFAKTYGLDPDDEPTIYGGTTRPDAWLENVSVAADGAVDFFDTSHTANGRCTFPMANIRHREPSQVPPARYLLILNRSDLVIPAVARLKPHHIAAYFMLGETKGTSAGGTAEAGKSLRVPGTNPFFFDDDAMQGNRLLELLETMPDLEAYVLNTGRVGGVEKPRRRFVSPILRPLSRELLRAPSIGKWILTLDTKSLCRFRALPMLSCSSLGSFTSGMDVSTTTRRSSPDSSPNELSIWRASQPSTMQCWQAWLFRRSGTRPADIRHRP